MLSEANERGLVDTAATANRALGVLDLAAGRAQEALRHLRTLNRDSDATHPGIALDAVPALVEAAVRAGEPEQATEVFAWFRYWVESADTPGLHALAAQCRGLLAAGDAAEAAFRTAIDLHKRVNWPMERAYTELLLGEHLRRRRRRADARQHLSAALETFQRIGALVWAERAHRELRAAGDTRHRTEPSTLAALTPQELRIVTAVSQGATNREVAALLFLSPRTVDYHLRKVFQKLGISSRTELTRLALTGAGDTEGR
ncbi:helix-turn-helix transcriptional regulator [Allosalinactinospora lopnorensis]|uniref:helix-turn-helix transcriptional regulator n=1 Tax=Allosalinactinospora lopnorensis TaxID=1352348 RepID=UPI0006992516|nr:helix-turn-helix transcriptional regulator [Allosalinactinospora lopnorensis]